MTATGPCAWCKTACVTAPVLGRAEASKLLTREYRKPFVVPENV